MNLHVKGTLLLVERRSTFPPLASSKNIRNKSKKAKRWFKYKNTEKGYSKTFLTKRNQEMITHSNCQNDRTE